MRVKCQEHLPLPLEHGKGAWEAFSAAKRCCPLLKALGHKSISISHYCFDRGYNQSLSRKMLQRHRSQHSVPTGSAIDSPTSLPELRDWALTTSCCNHDCHNALRWSVASNPNIEEHNKEIHIALESLKDCFASILHAVPGFLWEHVRFVDDGADEDEVAAYWSFLGVEADMLDTFMAVHPRWTGFELHVKGALEEAEDATQQLSSILHYAFRFRKYTDSRWCSAGVSFRSLLLAWSVGLDGVMQWADSHGQMSDYYSKG